ncbi:MAG: hypothetical protein II304_15515 [Bacteroidales bacterium]|nr:hypothetical protein [Bacteroidales bacterium]
MKFTKEEAYKELVGKIPSKGQTLNLSERSINEQLDTLMPLIANEETELNDFIEKVLPVFKTADGNVKNDVSVSIQKYKEEHPVQEPTKKKAEPQTGKNDDTELAKLLGRLEAMESELANAKREKLVLDTKSTLIAKLKEKGVKDESWANALLSEINITDDFDVDSKVDAYVNLYNKSQASVGANATPKSAGGEKPDYLGEAIKQAAAYAKSQNLIE